MKVNVVLNWFFKDKQLILYCLQCCQNRMSHELTHTILLDSEAWRFNSLIKSCFAQNRTICGMTRKLYESTQRIVSSCDSRKKGKKEQEEEEKEKGGKHDEEKGEEEVKKNIPRSIFIFLCFRFSLPFLLSALISSFLPSFRVSPPFFGPSTLHFVFSPFFLLFSRLVLLSRLYFTLLLSHGPTQCIELLYWHLLFMAFEYSRDKIRFF